MVELHKLHRLLNAYVVYIIMIDDFLRQDESRDNMDELDRERNEDREKAEQQIKQHKNGMLWAVVTLGIGLVLVAFTFYLGSSFATVASIIVVGMSVLGLISSYSMLQSTLKAEEARENMYRTIRNERDSFIQLVREGKWDFPVDEFYALCQASHITDLDTAYCVGKATQIAYKIIKEKFPYIEYSDCNKYFEREKLWLYLQRGQRWTARKEDIQSNARKRPRKATPNMVEKTFIEKSKQVARLSGCDKRIFMLTNLVEDYSAQIHSLEEGEKALRQLGMIYADQQKKESDWAIIGGIAEGIAGPAAGIMAAAETMANNAKIREHNAAMRRASMEVMSGLPSLVGSVSQLEDEKKMVIQKLEEAKIKITLPEPTAEEIWKNIQVGTATVEKNESGVLSVGLPITLKEAFVVEVPKGVRTVVDGTIKGQVWFEDKLVGDVIFPLPLYGIPSSMCTEIILDGMCERSVEFDGQYTVKIAEKQNLWIMDE